MDTRKVQSVGGGSYTVSIPKEWCEQQDITSGNVVNVHQYLDGTLVVQTQETKSNSSIESAVQLDHDEINRLEQLLRAAYTAGIKTLVLTATTEFSTAQRRIAEEVARNLTGVSITKASDTQITVQVLLNSTEISVSQSVRQLKFIALSMQEIAVESLTAESVASQLVTREDQVNRLSAMIKRSFSRSLTRLDEVDALGHTRPELFRLWETTRELERVADHAECIAMTAPAISDLVSESVLEAIQTFGYEARGIVADGVSVIIGDTGVATAHEALVARDELCESINQFIQNCGSKTKTAQLRLVLHRVRRTAEHGGNIAELGLQHGVYHEDLTTQKLVDKNS